ncbi:hypothetical protein H6H01_11060 [Nostoc calcicola FACHB-3891]|nr:hypothetical protein [Nostoc calcicola FACHB-3891]
MQSAVCQISDVWRQEIKRLRTFDDGADVCDVYDGLRLRCDLLRIRIIHS